MLDIIIGTLGYLALFTTYEIGALIPAYFIKFKRIENINKNSITTKYNNVFGHTVMSCEYSVITGEIKNIFIENSYRDTKLSNRMMNNIINNMKKGSVKKIWGRTTEYNWCSIHCMKHSVFEKLDEEQGYIYSMPLDTYTFNNEDENFFYVY